MSKKIIGRVVCPHCGKAANVYENARSRGGDLGGLLYYRCGEFVARGVSSGCGTVQIYGETGQAWIRANIKIESEPKGSHVEIDPAPEVIKPPVADVVVLPVVEAKGSQEKKSGGIFGNFINSLTGEI